MKLNTKLLPMDLSHTQAFSGPVTHELTHLWNAWSFSHAAKTSTLPASRSISWYVICCRPRGISELVAPKPFLVSSTRPCFTAGRLRGLQLIACDGQTQWLCFASVFCLVAPVGVSTGPTSLIVRSSTPNPPCFTLGFPHGPPLCAMHTQIYKPAFTSTVCVVGPPTSIGGALDNDAHILADPPLPRCRLGTRSTMTLS
jgi:hypothetical protein